MPTPEQTAYASKLNEIVNRFDRLDDATIRALIGQLQEYRRDISDLLTSVDPESFQAAQLQGLLRNVSGLTTDFQTVLTQNVQGNLTSIYELGEASVVDPLIAAGISITPVPGVAQLNAVSGFTADLIQGVSDPMRASISQQIRLSAIGGQTPFQAMRNITDILGVKARDGVWGIRNRPEVVKGVAARAEAILRTETGRVFNLAVHSQQQEIAQQTDIRKRWISTGDGRTRKSHLDAHGQERPVDEPFDVGGEQLRFPHDPLASPGETVNCRCRIETVHEDIGVIKTPLDARIAKEKQRRAQEAI